MPWSFHPAPGVVRCRLHLRSSPEVVYRFLSSTEGREAFWAERSRGEGDSIAWTFPDGREATTKALEQASPARFTCEYLDDSIVEFELEPDSRGGTDLTLTNRGVKEGRVTEVVAGWVSVLLNLKAVLESGADLRNHEADLSFGRGFVDN
jgi:uncharacterized protein YndB with AHSA1/START domain